MNPFIRFYYKLRDRFSNCDHLWHEAGEVDFFTSQTKYYFYCPKCREERTFPYHIAKRFKKRMEIDKQYYGEHSDYY